MIEIRYSDRLIKMNGHAGHGEIGKDIVCAGASALWLAVASKMEKEQRLCHVTVSFHQEKGNTAIFIKTIKPGYEERIREVWDTFICGMQVIASNYPDCVSLKKI